MKYRQLRKTDIQISEISLGAEHLEFLDKKTVIDVIHSAIDHGMNYMDYFMSSPNVRDYGGIALKNKRSKMMIGGHLGSIQVDGQYSRSRDLKQSEIYFEDLLKRMKTDYVDVLMLHFIDTQEDADCVMDIDGLLGLAQKYIKQGKARSLGFSSHVAPVARKLVDSGEFDTNMFSINPMFDTIDENSDIDGLFDDDVYKNSDFNPNKIRQSYYTHCASQDCSIIVMKGYGAGRLLKEDNGLPIVMTPTQCIEYALTRPGVASIAVGCKTIEHVKAAAYYNEATTEQKDFSTILQNASMGGRGACMYCNHCLPCPVNIDIAKNISIIDEMEQGSSDAIDKYRALDINGDACIECGDCEIRCPFDVQVIEKFRGGGEMGE